MTMGSAFRFSAMPPGKEQRKNSRSKRGTSSARWLALFVLCMVSLAWIAAESSAEVLERGKAEKVGLSIVYPKDKTLFPANIISPKIRWSDGSGAVEWQVAILGAPGEPFLESVVDQPQWQLTDEQWHMISQNHLDKPLTLSVEGIPPSGETLNSAKCTIEFTISSLPVSAPIFYRAVPLPARFARSNLPSIEWRLGSIGIAAPRTVLTGMTDCGNCHSFSRDGTTLGMDVDFGSDKGAYVIAEIGAQVLFEKNNVMTWSSFNKESKTPTYGLLSTVSPSGRHAVSTVNDFAVFRYIDDLDYCQLFFPVRGILVAYRRGEKTFRPIRGADDPQFVQTNPAFTPDGQWIVFARARALPDPELRSTMNGFIQGDSTYQYDLYRVPFEGGPDTVAEPLPGGSHNGMSNFFPKVSPDGKWIVFCKAKRFMLNQLDSELYIIPAEGGEARRLECNFPGRMNSWHSWSPDSRWLVFSSKANGPYTQLWLTHIDEHGEDTPPVLLDHLTGEKQAANIPEFVDIDFQNMMQRIINQATH
ncbi:hypothetical protein TRIP_B250426 [uncultured Desulfatiglans sp.]|nr:hypothetical protein TRIP_B250426 [uncultured Desulfatiglans sp.]